MTERHETELDVVRQALARAMADEYSEAVPVDHYANEIEGWCPDSDNCHDQVAAWLHRHPEDVALRGWVPWIDFGHIVQFASHSLVLTAAGEVLDVAKPRTLAYRCFIPHPAGAGDFLALVLGDRRVPWVDVPRLNGGLTMSEAPDY